MRAALEGGEKTDAALSLGRNAIVASLYSRRGWWDVGTAA